MRRLERKIRLKRFNDRPSGKGFEVKSHGYTTGDLAFCWLFWTRAQDWSYVELWVWNRQWLGYYLPEWLFARRSS